MGFAIEAADIQTARHAALQLVRSRGLKRLYLAHPNLRMESAPMSLLRTQS